MSNKDLPKVIPMRQDDTVSILKSLLKMAENGEIKNFVAAGFLKDGNVFTGHVKTDVIEQHTLISYLHSDAIIRTIEANYEN